MFFFDFEEYQERAVHYSFDHPYSLLDDVTDVREVEMTRKTSIDWETAEVQNGRVERTVWETLLEMKRFDYRVGEVNHGAIT